MMTSWVGDLPSTGARCSHVVRRLRWGYWLARWPRSPPQVKDGSERGGAQTRIPGDDARRAAELATRKEGRAEVGTDLSREPGLRTAWSAHADELYGFARRALGGLRAPDQAGSEQDLVPFATVAVGKRDPRGDGHRHDAGCSEQSQTTG